jgi:alkylation response protein AidB-like acyl-CoA dehydrogenase
MTARSITETLQENPGLAALVSEIDGRRDEIDRLSHVPRDVVEQMKSVGIFRASTPKRFGGDALPPAQFLPMLEAIATVDGSAAWVAGFGSANGVLASLPVETQAELYASGPDQVFAAGFFPPQPAEPADGGWTASGRWRFASGCLGANWIGIGIVAKSAAEGVKPDLRMAIAPAGEVTIIENWDVVGLQGTGSHDTHVQDKFYPEEWTFLRGAPSTIDEPLYRYSPIVYQAQSHATVNLGLARAALATVSKMSTQAKIIPGTPSLGERGYFRSTLARCEARLRSARSFFYETINDAWQTIVEGKPLSAEQSNLLRLSATYAAQDSAEIIQSLYRVAGMSAIHKSHRLQQIVRDSMVVTQHTLLSEATYEDIGGFFAGVSQGL